MSMNHPAAVGCLTVQPTEPEKEVASPSPEQPLSTTLMPLEHHKAWPNDCERNLRAVQMPPPGILTLYPCHGHLSNLRTTPVSISFILLTVCELRGGHETGKGTATLNFQTRSSPT